VSEQRKWATRDGTRLECDPRDPEDVRAWLLRNLDRIEDDVERAHQLSGRDGLHALANLIRERAATVRDQMEAEWKRATGGDPLPPELAASLDHHIEQQRHLAAKVEQQAHAATDMEQAGAASAIQHRRGRRAGATSTNDRYGEAKVQAVTVARDMVAADTGQTLRKAQILEEVARVLIEERLHCPNERVLWRWLTESEVIPGYVRKPGRR